MNRKVKLLLILIVLIGAGIALSYYIPFWLETRRTTEASSSLAALHRQARPTQTARQATETVPAETETPAPETAAPAAETEAPAESLTDSPAEEAPEATAAVPEATGNTAESRTEAPSTRSARTPWTRMPSAGPAVSQGTGIGASVSSSNQPFRARMPGTAFSRALRAASRSSQKAAYQLRPGSGARSRSGGTAGDSS